jgi:hypothetical protein
MLAGSLECHNFKFLHRHGNSLFYDVLVDPAMQLVPIAVLMQQPLGRSSRPVGP